MVDRATQLPQHIPLCSTFVDSIDLLPTPYLVNHRLRNIPVIA